MGIAQETFEILKRVEELEAKYSKDGREETFEELMEINDVESEIYKNFDKFSEEDFKKYRALIKNHQIANGTYSEEIV
jgi:hypothetical protein